MDHPSQRPSHRPPGAPCALGRRRQRRDVCAGAVGDLSPEEVLELRRCLEADASAAIAYLFDHTSEWLDLPDQPPAQP